LRKRRRCKKSKFSSLLKIVILGREKNFLGSGVAGSVTAVVSAGREVEAA